MVRPLPYFHLNETVSRTYVAQTRDLGLLTQHESAYVVTSLQLIFIVVTLGFQAVFMILRRSNPYWITKTRGLV